MKTRKRPDEASLSMTPMIDVVFQLLIFFIVTMQAPDVLANLQVSRPAAQEIQPTKPEVLRIIVGPRGWTMNGREYIGKQGQATMERHLARLASISRTVSIAVSCTADSPHDNLIRLLNACSREGLDNVSVFSL